MRYPKLIRFFLSISCAIALWFAWDSTMLLVRSQPAPTAQALNLSRAFQDLGVNGSIVIYDKNNQRFYEHNPSRNATSFFPGSTFKILNALISLETGVIPNDVAVLTWDGSPRDLPAWNRDTNLRQAFKDSTVWQIDQEMVSARKWLRAWHLDSPPYKD